MALYSGVSKLPVQADTLIRPRLDALLEKGMQFPAVVVAAGTGFGKTQAVASFLARSDYRSVWMQMTLLDNLPMRFWESFTHTVSLHRPAMGERLRELGFPDSLYKYHTFLALFTEELYADDQFVAFVFDDFHVLENASVREFFRHFVSAHLENICLVFLTRDMDSYSLRSNVHVITTEELRFTPEEAESYFAQVGVEFPEAGERESLYQQTDGWPMALYLVGRLLQGEAGQERLFRSQKTIFSLLDKEVFARYSPRQQEFFILLSVLSSFPEGLLETFAKQEDWDVRKALRDNAFITYDQQARSYYIHRIFLDFLRERQYTLPEEARRGTLDGAGAWCEQNGQPTDALDYFARAGDEEGIWRVVEGFEGARHPRDEARMLIGYMEKLSEDFRIAHPMSRIVYAALMLNNLNIAGARRQIALVLAQLEASEESATLDALRGEAYVVLGLISFALENFDFVEHFRRADALLPEGSRRWTGSLHLVEYSNALNILGVESGEVEKSLQGYAEGMPYVYRVLHGAGYGLEHLASAEAAFLRAEMRPAEREAYTALHLGEEKQQSDIVDNALFLLLRIFLALGDDRRIGEIMRRLKEEKGQWDGVPDIARGWLYTEIGEPGRVAGWILHDQDGKQPPVSVDKDTLLRVRCLIEDKSYYEALAVLGQLEKIFQKRNTLISMIYARVYRGIAHYQMDEQESAVLAIGNAYALAQGNGLIMPFIEYGHRTRSLLDYMRRRAKDGPQADGVPPAWLDLVHTKASTYAKRHAFIAAKFAKDAPAFSITAREADLLRNLSQGLTREEIAESMYVSPNTVKSMLKNVYSKIGAINSADAVRIALGAKLI